MKQTFSDLCFAIKISPNRNSPRNHKADTITIHCYVGQVTVENALNGHLFKAGSNASANYIICTDGRLIGCVPEGDRSWCSSSAENDNRAITIECASDTVHPYKINDNVYNTLILLLHDICKRNKIKRLRWSNNKADRIYHRNGCNMTVHRDFANKACPGEYLYNKQHTIAKQVNLLLKADEYNTQVPYKAKTLDKIAMHDKLGGKVVRYIEKGKTVNIAKIKVYKDDLWAKGLKTGQWFLLKNTEKLG